MTRDEILLDVRQLKQHFRVSGELTVKAVDGVSFQLQKGEIFGLVGESGCGKSTLARTLMGIYAPTAGEIFYKGDFISGAAARRKALCGDMQIVFQDSASALNPRMTVGEIIAEPLLLRGLYKRKGETEQQVIQLLRMVGMDGDYQRYYPGEISGGQRQRVAIARSIGAQPALIVADEPIASLDVSMQAQIVNLFLDLQAERQFSLLFITHDLSMVRFISDRVGVMYQGKLVEIAEAEELFANPLHPYTQTLLSAIPIPDPRRERQKKIRIFHADGLKIDGVLSEVAANHYVLR